MANEIQKTGPAGLSNNVAGVNQQAEKIVNVNRADSITTGNITNNMYFAATDQRQAVISGNYGTSHEYYNLFVQFEETFYDQGHFYVTKDRALNSKLTSDYIRDKVNGLEPEAIEQIKTFPAIFCSENHEMGKTDDDQIAYYGLVTDVKVQDNGIKIYYRVLNAFQQRILNENLFDLGLDGNNRFNELNHTHWAIKRIDLVTTLKEIGVSVFALF